MPATTASESGVASRYALALFELAQEKGELDRVATDLDQLAAVVADDAQVWGALVSPTAGKAQQRSALETMSSRAGFSEVTSKLLGLLAERRRLEALPGIVRAYARRMAQERGEANAEVITAVPLVEGQMQAVRQAIASFAGQNANIETRVDPSILGGVIVRVGSNMLDASLRTKLQQLEQSMKGLN